MEEINHFLTTVKTLLGTELSVVLLDATRIARIFAACQCSPRDRKMRRRPLGNTQQFNDGRFVTFEALSRLPHAEQILQVGSKSKARGSRPVVKSGEGYFVGRLPIPLRYISGRLGDVGTSHANVHSRSFSHCLGGGCYDSSDVAFISSLLISVIPFARHPVLFTTVPFALVSARRSCCFRRRRCCS